jgi:2-hydroxycyclohexanecarboxyl-CoA dehydrogenase
VTGSAGLDSPLAVVTGGGAGIGLAVVELLSAKGYRVALVDIDQARAEQAAQRFSASEVKAYGCDVSVREDVFRTAQQILQRQGSWSVLVPNVGWSPHKDFLELTNDEIARLVDLNLMSALWTTQAFLPEMIERGRGRICYVSSDAGRVGSPGQSVYSAGKAGVIAFAKSIAMEAAKTGVTANVVAPGTTDTAFLRAEYDEQEVARRISVHPMGRIATANDVAAAIGFFVADDSSFVTGQVLSVNGGSLRP